jgi:Tfp pilus assembly protein PilF
MLRHPISSRTRRMLHRAVDRMRSGDHQKAIYQLEATLSKDPSSAAYVHSLLGYEYMVTEQVTAAITCFEKAVLLLPHDPANHHNFAVSLLMAGNYERAEEEARRAHDLAPDNPEINRLLDALQDHAGFQRVTLNAQSDPKLN